jgi:hypothetical protein
MNVEGARQFGTSWFPESCAATGRGVLSSYGRGKAKILTTGGTEVTGEGWRRRILLTSVPSVTAQLHHSGVDGHSDNRIHSHGIELIHLFDGRNASGNDQLSRRR